MKNLIVEVKENGSRFVLIHDFTFYLDDKKITIRKGFDTDFASIPTVLIPILGLKFKNNKANVLHDFLYNQGKLTRFECDTIYKQALLKLGISKIVANLAYIGVRLFGKKHFKGVK